MVSEMRWVPGERPYRVAQSATGNTAMDSLKEVIAHPQLDLLGVYVYSDEKVGKDAGELAGLERGPRALSQFCSNTLLTDVQDDAHVTDRCASFVSPP
jgi:hypothetical protein